MKIGEYPRMNSLEDKDVFVFSRPSDGTKSIRVEDLVDIIAAKVSTEGFLNRVYPVGSIYISVNPTSPAEIMGGTWEAIHGRFLVAEGDNEATGTQSLNLTAGDEGGEKDHSLSKDELAAHTHTRGTMDITGSFAIRHGVWDIIQDGQGAHYYMGGSGITWNTAISMQAQQGQGYRVGFQASRNWTGATSSVGSGTAHNNLPPYLAVYMWKRTA